MNRASIAAACAALLFALSIGASQAGAPIKGTSVMVAATTSARMHKPYSILREVMVGLGPEGHRLIVTFVTVGVPSPKSTPAARPSRKGTPIDWGPICDRHPDNCDLVSYAYNPENNNVNQLPTLAENVNPTTGIGIVVKKNPGSPNTAYRLVGPDSHGTWTIDSSTMPAGNYNIVVTVQAHAVNTKGTGSTRMTSSTGASMANASAALPAKTMLLTFHFVVDDKGNMTMDSRMPPTVTAAPPREPTQ